MADSPGGCPSSPTGSCTSGNDLEKPVEGFEGGSGPGGNKDLAGMLVGVRVRRAFGGPSTYIKADEAGNTIEISKPEEKGKEGGSQSFAFDVVLGDHCQQEEAWRRLRVGELVDKVCDGYHGTVFAYGQTGAGKTHTILGGQDPVQDNPSRTTQADTGGAGNLRDNEVLRVGLNGLIPRAVNRLFKRMTELSSTNDRFTVSVSYLQIYNEKIYDLLNPTLGEGHEKSGLRMRWNSMEDFFVENLFCTACGSSEEVMRAVQLGTKHRAIASHDLNQQSSRSHCVLQLTVERSSGGVEGVPEALKVSKLFLVDLAGSERANITGTEGVQRKEASYINQSLFVLRRVITALVKQQQEKLQSSNLEDGPTSIVPYRESKLTSLLKCALGGNSYTIMIACVSPEDSFLGDTSSTLHYATQARAIRNAPKVNLDPKSAMIQALREQMQCATLRAQFAERAYLQATGVALQYPPELTMPRSPSPRRRTFSGLAPVGQSKMQDDDLKCLRGEGSAPPPAVERVIIGQQSASDTGLSFNPRPRSKQKDDSIWDDLRHRDRSRDDGPLSKETFIDSVSPRKKGGSRGGSSSPIKQGSAKVPWNSDWQRNPSPARRSSQYFSDFKGASMNSQSSQAVPPSVLRGVGGGLRKPRSSTMLSNVTQQRHSASAPRLRLAERRSGSLSGIHTDASKRTADDSVVPLSGGQYEFKTDCSDPGGTSALVAALDEAIAAQDDDALVSALLRSHKLSTARSFN